MAISNAIATVKNYVKDDANLYSVFRTASLTSDLETPMVHFIGAKTMSYPVFPKSTGDMPDYNPATGYERESATLVRREVTVSQDKGYQNAIDQMNLLDSVTTSPTNSTNVSNGVALLGSDDKIPASQLPSYGDDVIEGYYKNSKFYNKVVLQVKLLMNM